MTRIRFREGSWLQADDAARIARGQETLWFDPPQLVGVEPAQPGDCWRTRWWAASGEGPIAGYAICCPKCLQVHSWSSARNCSTKRPLPGGGSVCAHSGIGSCWQWSGSAEDGTLTASPSLHAIAEGPKVGIEGHGCGWHGWLQNGELKG